MKNIKLPRPKKVNKTKINFGSLNFTPSSKTVEGNIGKDPSKTLENIKAAINNNVFNGSEVKNGRE